MARSTAPNTRGERSEGIPSAALIVTWTGCRGSTLRRVSCGIDGRPRGLRPATLIPRMLSSRRGRERVACSNVEWWYVLMTMRARIDLPTPLLQQARKRAVESGTTLSVLVTDALRRFLSSATEPVVRYEVV